MAFPELAPFAVRPKAQLGRPASIRLSNLDGRLARRRRAYVDDQTCRCCRRGRLSRPPAADPCGVRRSEDRGTAGARPGSSRTSRSPRSPCSFTAGSEEGTCIEHRISISRAKHCRTISESEAPTWDLALDQHGAMLSVAPCHCARVLVFLFKASLLFAPVSALIDLKLTFRLAFSSHLLPPKHAREICIGWDA
jgi:hypothetical protein